MSDLQVYDGLTYFCLGLFQGARQTFAPINPLLALGRDRPHKII